MDKFHIACEEWDAEELTTEELLVIAYVTLPYDLLLDAMDHINALDGGSDA